MNPKPTTNTTNPLEQYEAWLSGLNAYHAGAGVDSNPHQYGTKLYDQWQRGYAAGRGGTPHN